MCECETRCGSDDPAKRGKKKCPDGSDAPLGPFIYRQTSFGGRFRVRVSPTLELHLICGLKAFYTWA